MRLQKSERHFPYRRYTQRRASLWRKLRHVARSVALKHDLCAWVFVLAMLALFVALEVLR
jgi:hypothetical protein